MTKRLLASALTIAALALGITACGDSGEQTGSASSPQAFDLDLDWYVNPDHAGIFTALNRGYFEDQGLDVKPHVPSDPAAPIKEVAAGRVDLAVSYEPEVLLARDQGLDIEAVAALVDSPLTSLISLPQARIASPSDLEGKTVGTAGIPYQSDYLETILGSAGLAKSDAREVNVGLNLLPTLIGGKVDAILGGFRNIEGVDLSLRGLSPAIVPVDQLGVPTYDELVLVAKKSTVDENPDRIRAFISALARGTTYAAAHPQEAADDIVEAGKGLDPAQTRAEVDATLPLLKPEQARPYGQMDAAEWQRYGSWMADHDLIEGVPQIQDLLTNELLPPAR
jgi:putative hydroxymethylpyrimidine transport system substrate-binding protein